MSVACHSWQPTLAGWDVVAAINCEHIRVQADERTMATRPCLISACLKKASVSSPPREARPSGSKTLFAVSGPIPSLHGCQKMVRTRVFRALKTAVRPLCSLRPYCVSTAIEADATNAAP